MEKEDMITELKNMKDKIDMMRGTLRAIIRELEKQ